MVEKYVTKAEASQHVHYHGSWVLGDSLEVGYLVLAAGITWEVKLAHITTAPDEPISISSYDDTKYTPVCVGAPGEKGDTGDSANVANKGAWLTSTEYAQLDIVTHGKTGAGSESLWCTSAHLSGSSTEPEIGADWATVWEVLAGGGLNGAGSGNLVKTGTFITNQVLGAADVNYGVKVLGTQKTVVDTVLSTETASTTATDGDVDAVLVKEAGEWKLKTADNFAKKYVPYTITAGAWQPSQTAGCGQATNAELATNKFNFRSLIFGYSTKSYACFKMKFPIGYDGGALKAYFEWHSVGTTSSGVRWGIQSVSVGDNETLDSTWGTAVEVTDLATGAAYKNLISPIMTAITPYGTPAGGETLEIRIYRDPTHGDDVLNESVYLDDVTILVPINKHSEY